MLRVRRGIGLLLSLVVAALLWGCQSAAPFSLSARFMGVEGLKQGAEVTIAGVVVGEVTHIALDPLSYEAVVTLAIAPQYGRLPSDTGAMIGSYGFLGERYVQLQPGGASELLQAGAEIVLTQPAMTLERLIGQWLFSQGGESRHGGW
ncbi:MCE family protein [Ectothiorhodospiraceae bacterium BW-2]|nr:MCE family protein [Ectothiorhodospiraceae bacterium BW-2]